MIQNYIDKNTNNVFGNRISKDYINTLPILRYSGRITVVDSESKLNSMCDFLVDHELIGFDTESRPAFRKGVSYPVALVQLSTQTDAYVIQLKKTGLSDRLLGIFENQSIAKIGIGLMDDIKKLKQLAVFENRNFIDLSDMAASKGIVQTGLRALSARYLNYRISKAAQKSNWALDQLSDKQLNYAATDAWASLQLYKHVMGDNNDYHEEDKEITI